jgi:hypothetical protein
MQSPDDVSAIAAEICDYLGRHPNAADSLQGVQAWWLRKRKHLPAPETVSRALVLLISRRAVRASRVVDGQLIYSRP